MGVPSFKSNILEKGLVADFLSLFFPITCVGCHNGLVRGENILCIRCQGKLVFVKDAYLPDNPVLDIFTGRLMLAHAMALLLFKKKGIPQKLLHHLKYKGRADIGEQLGKLMGKQVEAWSEIDVIVPVPIHPGKIRSRGYNQSALLAKGISEVINKPYEDGLRRIANTQSQTRKGRLSRWQNVQHVFEKQASFDVTNKHVLLVDDVVTTGATLEACGHVLQAEGCASLSVACAAVSYNRM